MLLTDTMFRKRPAGEGIDGFDFGGGDGGGGDWNIFAARLSYRSCSSIYNACIIAIRANISQPPPVSAALIKILDCGLPARFVLFGFGQFHDVVGRVLQRREGATAT